MFATERFVVTGIHRTGTTWLGRVLAKTGEIAVLHEPLNRQYGLSGVPGWYPFYDEQSGSVTNTKLEELFSAFFKGEARYLRRVEGSSLFRDAVRSLIGGKAERQYRLAFRRKEPKVLLKDPFCLFASELLTTRFDARVVVLTRHPAAHLVSVRRMGWPASPVPLLMQKGLKGRFAQDIDSSQLEGRDDTTLNSYFWLIAHRYIRHVAESSPDNVLVCRHEDLASRCDATFDRLCSFLGIAHRELAWQYVQRSTEGSIVKPRAGVLHEFSRDSRQLVKLWKKELSREEIRTVARIVGATGTHFYPDLSDG